MAFCTNCGKVIKEDAKFCEGCGAATVAAAVPRCPKCGKEIKGDSKFCEGCGAAIETAASEPVFTASAPATVSAPVITSNINLDDVELDEEPDVEGLSDVWAWLLAFVPILVMTGAIIVHSVIGYDSVWVTFAGFFLFNTLLLILDQNELKARRFPVNRWIWLGLIFIPAYLFMRAAETKKKYGYAIWWIVFLLLARFLPSLLIPRFEEAAAKVRMSQEASTDGGNFTEQQDNPAAEEKVSPGACTFDEIKTPPLMVFSDENIESTEGNEVRLFIDSKAKDSILAITICGETYIATYKFVFNNTLRDAEHTFCRYAGIFGEISSVEKKTLNTSKGAEKELREMFSNTRKTMYAELRTYTADNSNDAGVHIRNGMKYLESGDNNRRLADYDTATLEFTKAILLSQNNAEAYYGRARAYLRKGENKDAIMDYTQAIRLNPNDAISYSNRGRAYARLGDYDNAVSDFESAHRIDPNNKAIQQNLEKARRREKGL